MNDAEDTRRWFVLVDDTPICPERPLTALEAARDFLKFSEDDPDQQVSIEQCEDWMFD